TARASPSARYSALLRSLLRPPCDVPVNLRQVREGARTRVIARSRARLPLSRQWAEVIPLEHMVCEERLADLLKSYRPRRGSIAPSVSSEFRPRPRCALVVENSRAGQLLAS